MKSRDKHPQQMIALYHRSHETNADGGVRVWRHDWFHDQFEILTPQEFEEVKKVATRFSIPLIEAED